MTKMILFSCLFLSLSCSKKKEEPTPYEIVFEKARAYDPAIYEVMIVDQSKRVICENYGPNCLENTGKRWLVRTIELPVIGFATEEDAKNEAMRLKQYYYKNWLFDEVSGEPVLESFVEEVFAIKKAETLK